MNPRLAEVVKGALAAAGAAALTFAGQHLVDWVPAGWGAPVTAVLAAGIDAGRHALEAYYYSSSSSPGGPPR